MKKADIDQRAPEKQGESVDLLYQVNKEFWRWEVSTRIKCISQEGHFSWYYFYQILYLTPNPMYISTKNLASDFPEKIKPIR